MDPIEIYEGAVPEMVSELPPSKGYVTFLGVSSTDRHACMTAAVSAGMGASVFSGTGPHRLLLQCFRIDDTEATVKDFARVVVRTIRSSELSIGPRVADAWMAAFPRAPSGRGHRTAYGFILMLKPSYTLAEYSSMRLGSDKDWLVKAVGRAAPLVRDLVLRIADGGLCWPGPIMDPHGVGLYADPDSGEPVLAVVVDWSSCVMGRAPPERIMPYMLNSYKKFLDNIGRSSLDSHRDLFYTAARSLITDVR